uniref:Glycosyltransferase n=1 Tax=Polygala tenuifolia TaxID=355332 RepID=A0A3G3NBN3_9FABA|nr:UDP-glucosyltransferase UGT74AU1 [Polygala tenuifolia]
MENGKTNHTAHVVVLPFNGQGHVNPMLQFSKRLAFKGLKITFAATLSITKTMQSGNEAISFFSIFDDTNDGYGGPGGVQGYIQRFQDSVRNSLRKLVNDLKDTDNPAKCLVYDSSLAWALDLAKELGLVGASFFLQSCSAVAAYYPFHLKFSGKKEKVSPFPMPGLPKLGLPTSAGGSYDSPVIKAIASIYDNIEKADWILLNTYHELEEEVIKWWEQFSRVRAIGPNVPSVYIDKRLPNDTDYGFNLFKPNSDACMHWLNEKAPQSVVYVSFGSCASIKPEQLKELTWALRLFNKPFLWAIKSSEANKLPDNFVEETKDKGLLVDWCSQMEVLAHKAVGCFITHCGTNSIVESLIFGVPMVGIPVFLDQTVNGYFMEKFWKVGITPKMDEEKGISPREEIEEAITIVMDEERGKEIKENTMRLKDCAKKALEEGGSSDKHIDEFIADLVHS